MAVQSAPIKHKYISTWSVEAAEDLAAFHGISYSKEEMRKIRTDAIMALNPGVTEEEAECIINIEDVEDR